MRALSALVDRVVVLVRQALGPEVVCGDGDAVVLLPANDIESINWDVIEQTTQMILKPLREMPVPLVVVDLTGIKYFGSVFLALLLRVHKQVKARGGEMSREITAPASGTLTLTLVTDVRPSPLRRGVY